MKRFLLFAAIALLFTSCCGFSNVLAPSTAINFADKDVVTDRQVTASLSKTYILGIGGLRPSARKMNVVDELIKKADLQQNEVLAYVTVHKNVNFYLFIARVKFQASGFVVKPIENGPVEKPQQVSYRDKAPVTKYYEEVVVDTKPQGSVCAEYFITEKYKSGSTFENLQMGRRLVSEIKSDIQDGKVSEAQNKLSYLERWYYGAQIKDATIDKVLSEIYKML